MTTIITHSLDEFVELISPDGIVTASVLQRREQHDGILGLLYLGADVVSETVGRILSSGYSNNKPYYMQFTSQTKDGKPIVLEEYYPGYDPDKYVRNISNLWKRLDQIQERAPHIKPIVKES